MHEGAILTQLTSTSPPTELIRGALERHSQAAAAAPAGEAAPTPCSADGSPVANSEDQGSDGAKQAPSPCQPAAHASGDPQGQNAGEQEATPPSAAGDSVTATGKPDDTASGQTAQPDCSGTGRAETGAYDLPTSDTLNAKPSEEEGLPESDSNGGKPCHHQEGAVAAGDDAPQHRSEVQPSSPVAEAAPLARAGATATTCEVPCHVYIIGTCHVSSKSAEDVQRVVEVGFPCLGNGLVP